MFNPESFAAVSREKHKDRLRKWEQEQLIHQVATEEKTSIWQSLKKQLAKIAG